MNKKIMLFSLCLYLFIMINPAHASDIPGFWNGTKLPIGMVYNEYLYNETAHTMTDSNGLVFKKNDAGYMIINDNRYLAFALTGTVNSVDYKYTSMDFEWDWFVNETDEGHLIYATNNNPNFLWVQYYYFYEDPFKPMKIEHYLENNWNDISDMQMFYLMNVIDGDTVEYNQTTYNVNEHMGLHKTGNFNDLIGSINFNSEYAFNFNDIISDGFIINEFYIGSGSVLGNPNINISAIGFTKNGGFFPEGHNVTIDPTFSTDNIQSVSISPLDEDTFVVAWCDEIADDIELLIYDINGTAKISQVTVDSNVGNCAWDSVSTTTLNATHFVVGWVDDNTDDVFFSVYNISGDIMGSAVKVDDTVSAYGYVSVSAFNETEFVIGWFDRALSASYYNISFAIYTSSGSLKVPQTDVFYNVGLSNAASVSTFNSTSFVIASESHFKIYNSDGVNTTNSIGYNPSSATVAYVSTFDDTNFVIGYHVGAIVYDTRFTVYDSSGVQVTGISTADSNSFNTGTIKTINASDFIIVWNDRSSYDLSYKKYNYDGDVIISDVFAYATSEKTYFDYVDIGGHEAGTGIGLKDDIFIIAYQNSTTQAIWTAYNSDGTLYSLTVNSYQTNPATPVFGDTINMSIDVSTTGTVSWCNFTLTDPNSIAVIDNENGTHTGDVWNSSNYDINESGIWTVNVTCYDSNDFEESIGWYFTADLGTLSVIPSTNEFSQTAGDEELFNLTVSHTGNNNNTVDFNLTGDINVSSDFTITFEEDPATIEESESQNVLINITSNGSLSSGTYTGNITYNRTEDGHTGVVEITIYISGVVGDVYMTPETITGISMTDAESSGRVLTINNTGAYALSHCNLSIDSGLTTYTTFNTSDFTVDINNETQISMVLSTVPIGIYSAIVTATCTATATGGVDTDTSSLAIVITGASAGGGSSSAFTIIQEGICGDGVCTGDETIDTCPEDCTARFYMLPTPTEAKVVFNRKETGRIKIVNDDVKDKNITVTISPQDYLFINGDDRVYTNTYNIGRKVGLASGEAYVEWLVDLEGTNLSIGTYDYILTFDDGSIVVSYVFTVEVIEKPEFEPEQMILFILGGLLIIVVAPPFIRKYKRGKKRR